MSDLPAEGLCRQCNQLNPYTNFKCDFCHQRLIWAEAVASISGEKCPQCQHFNTYTQSNCAECGALLPWWECPAARHVAKGTVEKEQKSLAITIVVCLVAVFLVLCAVAFNVSPNH